MQLTITARHFDVTEPIKRHIEEKIQRLEKYAQKIVKAHVILDIQKYRHNAEITVWAKKLRLSATNTAGDMYSAIDDVIHSLSKQLKRHKDKIKDHAHRSTNISGVELLSIRQKSEGSMPQVVNMDLEIKPMGVEDAIVLLKSARDNFIVFYNVDTKKRNIICKRKDSRYGIIEI